MIEASRITVARSRMKELEDLGGNIGSERIVLGEENASEKPEDVRGELEDIGGYNMSETIYSEERKGVRFVLEKEKRVTEERENMVRVVTEEGTMVRKSSVRTFTEEKTMVRWNSKGWNSKGWNSNRKGWNSNPTFISYHKE